MEDTMSGPPNCASSYGTVIQKAHGDEDSSRLLWRIAGFLSLAILAEGYDVGVINGAVTRIQAEFDLSSFEVASIVSATPLFVVVGASFGGWMADHAGRRAGVSMVTLLLLMGPLIMAVAPDFPLLLCGRSITGGGIGSGMVITSTYIAEVAPARMKGKLVGWMELMFDFGILLGFVANWALLGIPNDWRIMLALGALLTVVLAVSLLCGLVPESPRWLFLHKSCNEGTAILADFADKIEATEVASSWAQGPQRDMQTCMSLLCPWNDTRLIRQLSAGLAVGVAQILCGMLVYSYYSSKVMMQVTDPGPAFLTTVIMGLTKMSVATGVMLLLDVCSLRKLFLASATVVSAASVCIALALSLSMSPWVVSIGYWLAGAGFGLGLGPMAKVYLMEVFPTEARSKGAGMVYFVSRSLGFASTLVFPIAIDGLGLANTFKCLAGFGVFGLLLIAFLVEDVKRTDELAFLDLQNPFVRRTS